MSTAAGWRLCRDIPQGFCSTPAIRRSHMTMKSVRRGADAAVQQRYYEHSFSAEEMGVEL